MTKKDTTNDGPPDILEDVIIPIKRYLSALDIEQADDLATEEVEVPEWNGWVTVRALAGVERDAYEAEIFVAPKVQGAAPEMNLQNLRARLVSRTIIDQETGARLFTDKDVAKLGLKSAAALDRVFAVAQRLSRLTNQDIKELADQMVKDPSADSGSALLAS